MQTKDRSFAEACFNALVSVMIYGTVIAALISFGVSVYGQAVTLFVVAVIKNYLIRRVANLGEQDG